MSAPSITRRRLVALFGVSATGALLAACAAPTPTATPVPAKPAAAPTTAPAAAAPATKPTDAPKPAEPTKPAAAATAAPAAAAKPVSLLPPRVADLRTLSGTVTVDGSSTVFPVSEAMAEEFQKATGAKVRVTVGISGTGGGFKKFCNDETDVSDASRPIQSAEAVACAEKRIEWVELPVAFDGLSVLVSPKNTFLTTIKVSELKKMWEPEAQGKITKWNQINPAWPDRAFKLYGPGADSGTFDYWTETINGKEKASRGDYTASEDDNVLVQGISSDPDALGYFGYAYYVENKDKLKLVGVDNEKGAGAILPSEETITGGTYLPLSRPIFIYGKVASLEKPEVREFLRFYVDPKNKEFIKQTGYIPFPDETYQKANERLEAKKTGSVFPGRSVAGTKLADLFAKEPAPPPPPEPAKPAEAAKPTVAPAKP
jgi:phosphate transport system substrate-binding protein